jgi:hypothetical protein
LVPTRGLDTVTHFFSKVKLDVIPNISVPNLWFRVRNIGKNTATDLRAELYSYFNSIIPDYFELSWRTKDSTELVKEVSLSYLRWADAFCPDLSLGISESEVEMRYDGISIARFPSLQRGRICDVTLHIFGEYGIEKWESLWLVATGDASNPISFEKARGRYRSRLWYVLVRLLRFVFHQAS